MTEPTGAEEQPLDGYKWTEDTHQAILQGMPGGGIDRLTQLAMGNDHLVTQPALLHALYMQQATPQQAGAINQDTMLD